MINTLRQQSKGFYRGVFALMVPMVLQNLITQTVMLADTFMVGMLGEQYLAAITTAIIPLFLFMIFTFGVQSGAGILVAQYWGKSDTDAINRILGIALYFSIGITLTGALVLSAFPHQILSLVTNDAALVEIAAPYARIVTFAQVLNSISMVYIGYQRSMENPRFGVIVLSISSVFSVLGNWVLIFGRFGFPAMGIQGAAITTLLARSLEVVIIVVYAFFSSRFPLKIKLILKPSITMFKDFVKYSLPVLLNEALWGLGAMLYPVILGHMGGARTILAAFNISGNLERLFSVAVFASGHATAIIIGREIGAGHKDTIESKAKSLVSLAFILGLVSGAVLMIARFTVLEPFVYPLFDLSPDAASAANTMLTILAIIIPMRTLSITMGIGILRGGGDVKALMYIDVVALYLFALPMASVSGLVIGAGLAVVYSAILLEELVRTTLLFRRVRSKKWINDVTRERIE
ncbi:MAG: MATE family efflux transporter [Oscillospiraceae bacterium]|nr:MATE family efflux transporter [Oscillospiraceae bacterium]